jgi:hypothetical protein
LRPSITTRLAASVWLPLPSITVPAHCTAGRSVAGAVTKGDAEVKAASKAIVSPGLQEPFRKLMAPRRVPVLVMESQLFASEVLLTSSTMACAAAGASAKARAA